MVLFISYSHDSDEHREWVLSLSERLRDDGYETRLDQYENGSPAEGWPRWILERVDEATHVLLVCTETYYRRFRGHEVPWKGNGVDWEGAIITQETYDDRSRTLKFVPILVRADDKAFVPEPVRGLTRYVLDNADSYASLCEFLDGVAGVQPRPVRNREPRARRTAEPLQFPAPGAGSRHDFIPPCQLPTGAVIEFIGRATQLKQLTRRLREGLDTAVVGPGGYGKTALAAEAIRAVVGEKGERLASSPFPDGIVMLDLYLLNVQAGFDSAWHDLAGLLRGKDFLSNSPAEERARRACEGRRILVIVEGAELAGRQSDLQRLLSVLDGTGQVKGHNRRLVLTRDSSQAEPLQTVRLDDRLPPDEAAQLFDSLLNAGSKVASTALNDQTRASLLNMLDGHPLAITWATGLIGRGDEDLTQLIRDWQADPLLNLTDPNKLEHSLRWLFDRSVRGLNELERNALVAAGMLAHAPFPVVAIEKALGKTSNQTTGQNDVRSALKRLVQCQLLRRVEGVSDQREFPHVFAYQFARALATSAPNADFIQDLGDWAVENLRNVLEARGAMLPVSALRVPLEHVISLMKSASAADSLFPLVNLLLYGASDRLKSLGRLDLVAIALQAVRDAHQRLPGELSASSHWQHEFLACLTRLGELATAQGNLPEAQRVFGEALGIAQRLAESDPANATWQRDLSVSLNKLGDLATTQGNLPEAQRLFGEALDIRERLAESDPANTEWQRDLSVSLNKLGALAMAQRNLPEAQRLFGAAVHIRERLAESDLANAEWQRDLSVSFDRLGSLAMVQGNLPEAQRLFGESLGIAQRLADSDPANAVWQRNLSVLLSQLGDVATAQGNLTDAQRLFREDLKITQRLAASDPDNAEWQRDLSYSFTRIGQLFMQQENWAEALPFLETSLAIDERHAAFDPTNVTWKNDVEISRRLVEEVRRKLKGE